MDKFFLSDVLRRVHEDEEGAVSLETVLIIGFIALPILAFLLTKAWPAIQNYFNSGLGDLQGDATSAASGTASSSGN
jgi:Flp pilus assembly pilin Flp